MWHTSEAPWPRAEGHRVIWVRSITTQAHLNTDLIAREAASDGCWPRSTNNRTLTGAEILAMNKDQPNLEKRHAQLIGTHHVAPVFLRVPARMHHQGLQQCSLYPEDRGCAAPTTRHILNLLNIPTGTYNPTT